MLKCWTPPQLHCGPWCSSAALVVVAVKHFDVHMGPRCWNDGVVKVKSDFLLVIGICCWSFSSLSLCYAVPRNLLTSSQSIGKPQQLMTWDHVTFELGSSSWLHFLACGSRGWRPPQQHCRSVTQHRAFEVFFSFFFCSLWIRWMHEVKLTQHELTYFQSVQKAI